MADAIPSPVSVDGARGDASGSRSGSSSPADAVLPVAPESRPAPSSGIQIFCKKRFYSLIGIYPECTIRDEESVRSVRLAWGDDTFVELEPNRAVNVEVYIRMSFGVLGGEGVAAAECNVEAGEVRRYEYSAPYVAGGSGTLILAETQT